MTDAEARTLLTETLKMCVKEFASLAPFLFAKLGFTDPYQSSILAAKTACNEVLLKVERDTDA